ncbi:hypothetical protein DM02DRAFT_644427 [Periconia macrospinosa]|uniref:Rhodopsin domain-containing protein n=1 Tax=Periconia macrospinosa TaxID=97972 RepID=A0A2V1DIW4_9PLEO|nr:hypothetical protein DM02DRAFT_644427 [Periconia macrospinosa]
MAGHELSSNPADYPPGYLQEYKGDQLIATSVVFIVLNIVFFVARLYARKARGTPTELDDWFIWPALIINLAVCLEAIFLINAAGVGYHLAAVKIYSPHKLEVWSKGVFACVWLWALPVCLPKLSILGFYLRFFTNRIERFITYGTMMIVAATFVATGITTTFQCSPVAYQWDKTIHGGKCIDVLAFYRWMSFPNIVTDIIGLVLPLRMIWRLHVNRHQKIGITIMFVTGSAGLVTSVIRFIIFFNHDAFQDNTWTSVELMKWTDIEPGIYFIAACMPSLRPLLQVARQKTITSTRKDRPNDRDIGGIASEPEDGIAVRKDIWVVNHAA